MIIIPDEMGSISNYIYNIIYIEYYIYINASKRYFLIAQLKLEVLDPRNDRLWIQNPWKIGLYLFNLRFFHTAVYEAILLAVFLIFLGPWISHTNP